MAELKIYTARNQPSMQRWRESQEAGLKLVEYLVPVEWWAYADDRLDGRGDAVKNEAFVAVKAYDALEARGLVWREWGDIGGCRVGDAKIREVK